MIVKRENWKGKYVVVARDERGVIKSWIKYRRGVPIGRLRQHFKSNFTLDLNAKVTNFIGRNFREFKTTVPKSVSKDFQIILETTYKGKYIVARSDLVKGRTSIPKARKEAEERFYGRVARELFGEEYDKEVGEQLSVVNNLNIKESMVYYKRI